MIPPASRPAVHRRPVPRLLFGLVLFGLGIALMARSDLGLAPWDVMHQGISRHTGIPMGTVGIGVGLLLLLAFRPLDERIGLGTVLNVLVIGTVIDLTMLVLGQPADLVARWSLLVAGIVLVAVGSGFYIGAGLGPGPRDGLMTGLARRGMRVGPVRAGIEVSVLLLGVLLGGTVGAGTVAFAVGIGPLVGVFLPRLSVADVIGRAAVPPPGPPSPAHAS